MHLSDSCHTVVLEADRFRADRVPRQQDLSAALDTDLALSAEDAASRAHLHFL